MNKNRNLTVFVAGLCAYVATVAAFGLSENASATTIREVNAGVCHAATDDVGSTLKNQGSVTFTGTGIRSVYCPVVSDAAQYASAITNLRVHGREGTDGAASRACSSYPGIAAFYCSSPSSWSNNQGTVADVSVAEWGDSRSTEYRYMRHDLTQNSEIYGMLTSGN